MSRTLHAAQPRAIVMLAAIATLVAACGGATTTPSPSAAVAPPSETGSAPPASVPAASGSPVASAAAATCGTYAGPPVTITYAMWGDTTELANQQKIVDAFHAMNPNITVKASVADWDSYWPKLQTDLAGGNAPDVFLMDGPLYPDYQTRDQLLDLTPYIAKDGFDTGQLVDLAVQDFTAPDGHLYGLPRDLNTIALFYNKTMFDTAGIPYPDATWDWAKLREVAKQLTLTAGGKTTQWGFYHRDVGHGERLVVARLAGRRRHPQPRQEDRRHRHGRGRGRHPVPPGPHLQGQGHGAAAWPVARADLFEKGQAAMEANGSWLVPTHEAAGLSFDVAPLPKGPAGQATSVNPSGVVAYKGSKAPDAAWEFIKCYTGPELQAKVASLKASMPVNKQVLTEQYATSFDGGKTFADALSYAHLKPSFKGYDEFNTALQGELDEKVFNDNQMTAKAALDEVTPQLQQLLGQ